MNSYKRSIFIFRRDLRVDDNTGLDYALENSEYVIPCFIFDPRLIEKNDNFNPNSFQFLIESLEDLKHQLNDKGAKLYLFHGIAENVVTNLINKNLIDAVFVNRDYTPFSKKRDEAFKKACEMYNVDFISCNDLLLNNPDKIKTQKGTPYTVFTPFFKKASKFDVNLPEMSSKQNFYTGKIENELNDTDHFLKAKRNKPLYVKGGRSNALKILENLDEFKNYENERDYPFLDATTGLSAHNKFGTISIREFYYTVIDKLGISHPLITQLYWRDFYTYLAHHYPYIFKQSFKKKFDSIEWDNDSDKFKKWCAGETGFPIVDAGIREMNYTGYMHNRVRMITASFLVKDLHIDWKWGEQYFARKLVDYDKSVNIGNWQWSASTGPDAQPFFRIFNPWSQQKKFDSECIYIKKWIEELRNVSCKSIHNLENKNTFIPGYPEPIINHKTEREKSLAVFRLANQK
ncbi:Deoxyribodipyrimidine photo-lyase [Methanohalobium evestigatum Z-7303]|uniref:Deoxyribodipyrimidine photo-lyase n=1 Tax=Methanohalobium evestigatum (strain ATCC BAA-1072 / DSM 3721 / NBRC 107634 / OCM 161 / Z-7303) TaxID=644295 RepID=D7E970_METEZ|nr:deoxyribodipyrimidine photo-lyase [Methanohalobium evestigatum]ADI74018.1 Deoxyribodipyrimidine photo-lyase [Methanohalobium evestigatum Z-7303]